MRYRKRPVVVDASQWFKHGDHQRVEPYALVWGERPPHYDTCPHCKASMTDHGWIFTLEGGHIVCPDDWIITGVKGEHYPCKPDIFQATYEEVTS